MDCESCPLRAQQNSAICARCRYSYCADMNTKSAAALVVGCVAALAAFLTYQTHEILSFMAFLVALFSVFYCASCQEHLRKVMQDRRGF